jgi:excisionase family DNA binding protein
MIEPLIDPKAAGTILGASSRQVKRMAAAGEIPALQIGNRWKFRESALDNWIAQRLEFRPATVPARKRNVV